jgi:hypothetical protein
MMSMRDRLPGVLALELAALAALGWSCSACSGKAGAVVAADTSSGVGAGGAAGGTCGYNAPDGSCAAPGLDCRCCPVGGPNLACLCTTSCSSDGHCTDPARPVCNKDIGMQRGFCTPILAYCCWGCE